jgi:histone-lysine N-methyltransferase SETMAR
LPTGRFICLYAGEFIDQAQARQRFIKQESQGQGNYILCMRENDVVIGFVDPTVKGNIGYVDGRQLFSADLT